MQKYKKFRETPNFSYLCIHGKASGQDIRRAETLLGLHRIPARTGAYHPFGDGRARHPGPDAHGRRKVAYLPDPRACAGGAVHRRDAPDRPDERPGRPPAGTAHPGRGDPFGALAACNRHRAGQLRLRRRQVPLRRPRAARNGGLPPARRAHERIARGRRRSPLHLTVGLRFPPLVPAHRRAAREVARCPGAGAHGLGHETRGRRHHRISCGAASHVPTFRTASATPTTRTGSCCAWYATSPVRASSTSVRAKAPSRSPTCCAGRV